MLLVVIDNCILIRKRRRGLVEERWCFTDYKIDMSVTVSRLEYKVQPIRAGMPQES